MTEIFRHCLYALFNTLVLAVPEMEQLPESGTFTECKMVFDTRFSCHPSLCKNLGDVKLLGVPKMGQML